MSWVDLELETVKGVHQLINRTQDWIEKWIFLVKAMLLRIDFDLPAFPWYGGKVNCQESQRKVCTSKLLLF